MVYSISSSLFFNVSLHGGVSGNGVVGVPFRYAPERFLFVDIPVGVVAGVAQLLKNQPLARGCTFHFVALLCCGVVIVVLKPCTFPRRCHDRVAPSVAHVEAV